VLDRVCGAPVGASVRVRKSFSGRAGRKRKPGCREPNGQLQRLSQEETEAEVISIALAQPHRKGDRDQRRATFVGRLILDGKVRCGDLEPAVLVLACEHLQRDHARWQRAVESRRPLAVTGGRALRPEDLEEDAKEYASAAAAWAAACRSLRDAGERVESAAAWAILFAAPDASHETMAPWVLLSLPAAVSQLVKHYKLVK
jgi:hypothetical protein